METYFLKSIHLPNWMFKNSWTTTWQGYFREDVKVDRGTCECV